MPFISKQNVKLRRI